MIKAALTFAMLAATPAVAQDFTLPAGCDAYLTIQSKGCSVSHHFTCEGDAAGDQRRATLDEEGLTYVGRINIEAEWVESFHLRSGHSEELVQSADRMMISELIDGSVDTFEFTTDSREIGVSRYVGMDRLTGETVNIDGVSLLQTEYAITAYDGQDNVVWSASGREYINPEWRMFIGGISTYVVADDSFESDNTPVEFIFPGETGFLSVNPKFECGVVMSSLNAPIAPAHNKIDF